RGSTRGAGGAARSDDPSAALWSRRSPLRRLRWVCSWRGALQTVARGLAADFGRRSLGFVRDRRLRLHVVRHDRLMQVALDASKRALAAQVLDFLAQLVEFGL